MTNLEIIQKFCEQYSEIKQQDITVFGLLHTLKKYGESFLVEIDTDLKKVWYRINGDEFEITYTDGQDLLENQTDEFMKGFVEMITPTFSTVLNWYDGDIEFEGVKSVIDIIEDEYVSNNSITLEKFKDAKPQIYFANREDEFEIESFNNFFARTLQNIYDFVKQEFSFIDTTRNIAF
jgi:hypothetical protein